MRLKDRHGIAPVDLHKRFQDPRIAGRPVELDEAHLGDLVAGPDGLLAGAERAVEQLRAAQGHVEERSLPRRLVIGHRYPDVERLAAFVRAGIRD